MVEGVSRRVAGSDAEVGGLVGRVFLLLVLLCVGRGFAGMREEDDGVSLLISSCLGTGLRSRFHHIATRGTPAFSKARVRRAAPGVGVGLGLYM